MMSCVRRYLDDSGSDDGSSSYESDWEGEVTARGEVFYVQPVQEREMESFTATSHGDRDAGKKKEKKVYLKCF